VVTVDDKEVVFGKGFDHQSSKEEQDDGKSNRRADAGHAAEVKKHFLTNWCTMIAAVRQMTKQAWLLTDGIASQTIFLGLTQLPQRKRLQNLSQFCESSAMHCGAQSRPEPMSTCKLVPLHLLVWWWQLQRGLW